MSNGQGDIIRSGGDVYLVLDKDLLLTNSDFILKDEEPKKLLLCLTSVVDRPGVLYIAGDLARWNYGGNLFDIVREVVENE